MKRIIATMGLCAALAAFAYSPPVIEQDGVSLAIDGLDQGPKPAVADWDRKKIGVREFDAAVDLPLSFTLSNGTAKAVSGTLSVWMNEDWSVSGGDEAVTVAPGEVKTLKRVAKAKPSVLPALYPVHAKFVAEGVELHPIAVFRAKTSNRAFRRETRFRERIFEGQWRLDVGFRKTVTMHVGGKSWTVEDGEKSDPVSNGVFHRAPSTGFAGGVSARRGFVVHPPYKTGGGEVTADFPVELPATKDGIRFRFFTALSNVGKERNPGDGTTMRVLVGDGGADTVATQFEERYSHHVPACGTWHAGEVGLSAYAGRKITLRLAVNPGPKGNTTFDSCAWGDPVIEVGKVPEPPDERTWRAREGAAAKKAKRALDKGTDEAAGVYRLEDGGRSFGAGIECGEAGILDAAIAFTDGRKVLSIRGFEVELDGERLMDLRSAPSVGTRVFVEKGALKVEWKMGTSTAGAPSPRNPPRFTRLAPGQTSHMAKRIYAGTGCVWEGLEKLVFRSSGFALSTRHVGMDYDNGLSLVEAVDLPADLLEVDSSNRIARLVTHNDAVFSFVPSDRGAFDAAVRFANVSGYRASPGLPAMKNRICIDDWSGGAPKGYLVQAAALRLAKKYGLDDVLYLQHNWQRWGYDARLPEVYPPRGDKAEFDEMVRAAKESGYLFGIHDNYVDYYPDAEGFSYRLFCYNEDGTPLEAWYNPGPRSLSYRWLPQAIHPRLRANMALQRDGFHPNAIFLDVFTASGAKDVIDHAGRFHPHGENLKEWCRAWMECREVYGIPGAVAVSEAGSDSQIGYVDAGEADHFNPRYQAWNSTFADGERVPWHDAVSHGKMLLFGGGLGSRYCRVNPGVRDDGDRARHGYGTDDYLSTTVIGGRVPMGPSFGRITARTYWMLHDVCGALGQAAFESLEFVDDDIHRLHTRFSNGGEVWANRATNAVWRLADGRTLPTYGYYARVPGGIEAGVEILDGIRAGYARAPGVHFVDARPKGVDDGTPKFVASKPLSATVEGRVVRVKTLWDVASPIPDVYRPFTHVVPEGGKGIAFHGSGVRLTPAERTTVGRHEAVIEIPVPANVKAGDYAVMYGMYNPTGRRLAIRGFCDDDDRVRGGIIRVERPEGAPMRISWLAAGGLARDRELGLNVEGKVVDFGGIRTDGAFRLTTADWTLTPLPGSGAFRAEIDLAKFGAKGRRISAVEMIDPLPCARAPTFGQKGDLLTLSCDGAAFAYRLRLE